MTRSRTTSFVRYTMRSCTSARQRSMSGTSAATSVEAEACLSCRTCKTKCRINCGVINCRINFALDYRLSCGRNCSNILDS